MRAKTIKVLEGNIGVDIYYLGFGNVFLDMALKAQTTKKKKEKLRASLVVQWLRIRLPMQGTRV